MTSREFLALIVNLPNNETSAFKTRGGTVWTEPQHIAAATYNVLSALLCVMQGGGYQPHMMQPPDDRDPFDPDEEAFLDEAREDVLNMLEGAA